MKIPLVYNLRSVTQRPVSTALTALGIGLVVAVFVAMLALANGFIAALTKTGSPDNVLLLRRGADSELSSGIPREAVSIISASPHIAIGADGRPLTKALPGPGKDLLGRLLLELLLQGPPFGGTHLFTAGLQAPLPRSWSTTPGRRNRQTARPPAARPNSG